MIPFHDLKPLHRELAEELASAIHRVLESGWYVLGPEVEAFENEWASYLETDHAIGVANGTDALELALRAAGIGPGDEVITVALTAVATVCAITRTGATPVFADVSPDTLTMDAASAAAAITSRTRAILPVHLYGHPANLTELAALAQRRRLLLIEDCAQAHGATWQGRPVGTIGDLGCFSFYPTKNLGACGDAGAVVTGDAQLAARLRRLRSYGQRSRDESIERGINSRLDELQAAILRIKLRYIEAGQNARRQLAAKYSQELGELLTTPVEHPLARHVYHLYVVRHAQRRGLRLALKDAGIETLIHYPIPIHRQTAYQDLNYPDGSLPQTEMACQQILSLPLYIGLVEKQVEQACAAIKGAVAGVAPR